MIPLKNLREAERGPDTPNSSISEGDEDSNDDEGAYEREMTKERDIQCEKKQEAPGETTAMLPPEIPIMSAGEQTVIEPPQTVDSSVAVPLMTTVTNGTKPPDETDF